MFCWPFRRKGRNGDPPEAADRGIFHEPRAPKDSPGAAGPWQPDPEEFSTFCRHRRPGKGWGPRWAGLQSQDGIRPSQGAGESWRDAGMPGEAGDVPGCAQADGREPGSGRNGRVQQEQLKVGNTPSGIRHLGKDVRDEPGVPRTAQNGNVPREGMDQPQPPRRDEEGEAGGSSRSPGSGAEGDADAATGPGGDGWEPEPLSGVELRRRLRERLRQLGQDTRSSEGKSTAALAAQLAEKILSTPTEMYPSEPGMWSVRREQGSGAGRDLELGVPVRGSAPGNDGIIVGMLQLCGNVESSEEEEEEEEEAEEKEKEKEEEEEEEEGEVFLSRIYWLRVPSGLAQEFPEVWARSRLDCGRLAEEERLDGAPVGFQEQRPEPPDVEERMAELLREYREQGIVVEGSSASNNPLILIRKHNRRGWRLTLDCRALNEATPVEPPERPDKARLLASVSPRSRFFSVLDLSNACLAIPLARSSWPRFAFTFQGRQFLFTRLPPTFRGSSSVLHRRVRAMLARLEPGAAPGVFHYYDDILVTGKSRRQAEYRTRRVLELIQSVGFKANPRKAQLVRREVDFLGVTIGAAGQRVPEGKVEEIRRDCDALRSCSAGALRSVLGKFGSWRCFIPDYWELALPLQRLVERRDGEWERGWRQRLRRLMEALEAAPVLRFPDKSRPFLIRLSPHQETAGAALLQEKAGVLLPVGHCSRILSRWNFSEAEMGCMAAVRAVHDFEAFTGPAPVVISDSMRNYLVRGEALGPGGSGLPEQWTLLLTYRGPEKRESQSIAIVPAPELRYLLPGVPKASVWFLAVESRGSSVGFAAVSLEERWLLGGCQGTGEAELEVLRELLEQHRSSDPLFLYSGCPELAARLERWEREPGRNPAGSARPHVLRWLRAFPGMLRVGEPGRAGSAERAWISRASARAGAVAGSSWKIWEPSKYERQEIVARCHRWHEGVDGTLARVREVASWEGDWDDVAQWVLSCPKCRDPDPDADPGPQRAEGPWSCLWISLSKPLPRSAEGFCALLVVQDALSGWVDAFPLWRRAEPDVTGTLLREVFGNFGTVASVLLAPAPAWMWDSMSRAPLRGFWSRLERSGPHAAAEGLWRVAQAAGKGWAGMLPLILAGIRSFHARRDELRPLLCVPGLPLELRWEGPGEEELDTGNKAGNEAGNDAGNDAWNELSWLRRTRLLPGYREHVEAALHQDPGSGLGGWQLGWTGGV